MSSFRLLRRLALWAGGALACTLRADDVPTSAGAGLVSQYLYRGERLGGASVQSWVEADPGTVGVGLWTDFPVASRNNPAHQSNPELDPYAYDRLALGSDWALIPAFQIDTYPGAQPGAVPRPGYFQTRYEPSVAVDYRTHGLTFEPKVTYDFTLRGETYELTALYAVPLSAIGSELDLKAQGGYFDYGSGEVKASPAARLLGRYWLGGVTLPFQLGRHAKVSVGWAYTAGWHDTIQLGAAPVTANPLQASRGVASAAVSWAF